MSMILLAALTAVPAAELPPASEIEPAEVVRTGDYSEGVVVDHAGNLYFSHGKVVTRVTPEGEASVWAETGAPNGHKILADGSHLICDGGRHAVLHLDASGRELAPASDRSEGQPLRGPNDLTLDTPNGGFYFTDPGGSNAENPIGTVHYVDREKITRTVARGLAFPNGIALRPDGKTVLVAESRKNRVLAYPVLAPGKLGEPEVFADLPTKDPARGQVDNQPDGIALDAAGNLYVAHYGMREVQVLGPTGELIRRYPGGNLRTSNVAFAGEGHGQLYVTGGDPGALFRLDLGVPGLEILPPARPGEARRATVSGTVTLGGKPLEQGTIRFEPVEPVGAGEVGPRPVEAPIRDGRYALPPGDDEDTPAVAAGLYRVGIAGEGVPPRHQDAATSGLSVRIEGGGPNILDFYLEP